MSTVNFTLIIHQSYETNVSIKCSQSEIKLFAQKICKVNLSRCNSNDQEKKGKKKKKRKKDEDNEPIQTTGIQQTVSK